MRKLLMVVPLAVTLGLSGPAVAASKPTAANGARCTIVGTSKSETLKGTGKADVICGLGGNDTISGGGGNDVIDGGSGHDRLNGDSGHDRLYGGTGDDAIDGGTGNDTLEGGEDDDRLAGGTGDDTIAGGGDTDKVWAGPGEDRITGGSGSDQLHGDGDDDVVHGDSGNDRIYGGTGHDAVSAGSGADKVWAGTGDDTVHGGPGFDMVTGEDGTDRLLGDSGSDYLAGGDGDDILVGGAGTDQLLGEGGVDLSDGVAGEVDASEEGRDYHDGGAGQDWCVLGSWDTFERCTTDTRTPSILEVSATPSTVETSAADARTRLRVHVTDREGAAEVWMWAPVGFTSGAGRLVSGTVRDGWWELEVRVARHTLPGQVDLTVGTLDRAGHETTHVHQGFTVTNANPDTQPPVVSEVVASPVTVDPTGGATSVTVTARITDTISGVSWSSVRLWAPDGDTFEAQSLQDMHRISGTATDGLYRAVIPITQFPSTGTWRIQVDASDVASPNHGLSWSDATLHDALLPTYGGSMPWAAVFAGDASFDVVPPGGTSG